MVIYPLNYSFGVQLDVLLLDLQSLQAASEWTQEEYKKGLR